MLWYARKRGTISNLKGHLMQHGEIWKELLQKEEQLKAEEATGSTGVQGRTQTTLRDFARTITTPGKGKGVASQVGGGATPAKRKRGRDLDYSNKRAQDRLVSMII